MIEYRKEHFDERLNERERLRNSGKYILYQTILKSEGVTPTIIADWLQENNCPYMAARWRDEDE